MYEEERDIHIQQWLSNRRTLFPSLFYSRM
jgi:hypothetical protein